jgi:glycosyltransferase involved in cell wall biosynthesis
MNQNEAHSYILIVAYHYPPIQSAGVERTLKFAQYLPEYGFTPIILTTSSYGSTSVDQEQRVYRASDLVHDLFRSMRRDRETRVPRAEHFRVPVIPNESPLGRLRDRIMIPDTKMGWLIPAVRLGRALVNQYQPVGILSTSPPETAHLVARHLSCQTHVPWIVDLRDGWLFEPPNPKVRTARLRRAIEERLEGRVVRTADVVVTVTAPIAEDLRARYHLGPAVRVISNGYDAAEFAGLQRQRGQDGLFRLVHTGSLGSSRQGISPESLFSAIALLLRESPDLPLRVTFVGTSRDEEKAMAAEYGLSRIVEFVPPVSRRAAHQYQIDADALLLVTAPGQTSVATLKIFDYIGAGVPILALAKGNVAADIISEYGLGIAVSPVDADAIAQALRSFIIQGFGTAFEERCARARRVFERRVLTSELASIFDEILAKKS